MPVRGLLTDILRLPLRLIPAQTEMRIIRGPLRGKKWIAGASTQGCWMGTYEPDSLLKFASTIDAGASVYDIGANVGIYTLLASAKTGPDGMVYSFEPLPRNVRYLRRHIEINGLTNCEVVEAAVSDVEGARSFLAAHCANEMGHLSDDGDLTVNVVKLDSFVPRHSLRPPAVIKIDVEGAEVQVLHGGTEIIDQFHPSLFIEIHGGRQHAECRDFVLRLGYKISESWGHIIAL